MGAGLPMDKGDVAFKCNFATVQQVERETTERKLFDSINTDGWLSE